MSITINEPFEIRRRISESGVSVYEKPADLNSPYYYTAMEMQALLREHLIGNHDLVDLPLRTRSKVAKSLVCEALGYSPPSVFKRTIPRLPHPNVDVYAQQSNNLQIWNDEVDGSRRYVLLILKDGVIREVFVIPGADLASFDQTGTLTSKYQAARIEGTTDSRLVSAVDTDHVRERFGVVATLPRAVPASALPEPGLLLSVESVYARLLPLVGRRFTEPGLTQERSRGEMLHRAVCESLRLAGFDDTGAFPDVISQLVEVKLQLARTVDLGLELPTSDAPLSSVEGLVSARDVRYAIFFGSRLSDGFEIDALIVVKGEDFFTEFRQFGGKVKNTKLQLRLPPEWFTR